MRFTAALPSSDRARHRPSQLLYEFRRVDLAVPVREQRLAIALDELLGLFHDVRRRRCTGQGTIEKQL
jgi:hypothetical protein